MPYCVPIDAANILHCVYTQNSLKTKQSKVDYTIIRMSHNVTIRYRCKLFAHKLAVEVAGQMSQQQQKARVKTAIDWAQVMMRILVSCAIAPLYTNVECTSREKELFLL